MISQHLVAYVIQHQMNRDIIATRSQQLRYSCTNRKLLHGWMSQLLPVELDAAAVRRNFSRTNAFLLPNSFIESRLSEGCENDSSCSRTYWPHVLRSDGRWMHVLDSGTAVVGFDDLAVVVSVIGTGGDSLSSIVIGRRRVGLVVASGDQRPGGVWNGVGDATLLSRWLRQRLRRAQPDCRRSTPPLPPPPPPTLKSASDPPMTGTGAATLVVLCVSSVGADNPIGPWRVERLARGARLPAGGWTAGFSSDVTLTARPLTSTTRDVVPASGCDETEVAVSSGCEQDLVVVVWMASQTTFTGAELLIAQLATVSVAVVAAMSSPAVGGLWHRTGAPPATWTAACDSAGVSHIWTTCCVSSAFIFHGLLISTNWQPRKHNIYFCCYRLTGLFNKMKFNFVERVQCKMNNETLTETVVFGVMEGLIKSGRPRKKGWWDDVA